MLLRLLWIPGSIACAFALVALADRSSVALAAVACTVAIMAVRRTH